jgi:hypothetical protein
VRSGSKLYLKNISIVNSAWLGVYVEQGAVLILENCEFYGHGSHRGATVDAEQYYGAAIWNEGSLMVNNCTFDHNFTPGGGAAIYNARNGSATIRSSYFRNSIAEHNTDVTGAAVLNFGTLTIENSEFIGNESWNGSGAALASFAGKVILRNVIFENNKAKSAGAAIYNAADSTMTLDGGRLRYNTAQQGGGIYNLGSIELRDTYIDLNTGNCYNAGKLFDPEGVCG